MLRKLVKLPLIHDDIRKMGYGGIDNSKNNNDLNYLLTPNNIDLDSGYILMFFVTVLQKDNQVYECQEYQTLDANMQTLDLVFVCRELVQPYQKGIGT